MGVFVWLFLWVLWGFLVFFLGGALLFFAASEWLAPDPRAGVLVELGALTAIEYETNKTGDGVSVYRHEFGDAAGRGCPVLAVTPDRRLVIAGGRYRVRDRGIVG